MPDFSASPTGVSVARHVPGNAATWERVERLLDSVSSLPAGERYGVLEEVRGILTRLAEEWAGRYRNKPLPLGEAEENCLRRVTAAWQQLAGGYALCLPPEKPEIADSAGACHTAGLLYCGLLCRGQVILEHYRARCGLPAGAWRELHGVYALAEDWGLALTPLASDGAERPRHCCAAAYVGLLLVELANPYGRSVRDIDLIRGWAELWAPLVAVRRPDAGGPAYVLELKGDEALRLAAPEERHGVDVRQLDTAALAAQIGETLAALKNKVSPSSLGLGDENFVHVSQLLQQVARPWRQAAAFRRFRRFPAAGTARLCGGFEAMHYHVSGREFVRPDAAAAYSREEYENLFTFREQVDGGLPRSRRRLAEFAVDEWQVENHSANGFRLSRSAAGLKVAHGQLLAIRPHDGEHFLLAQAVWLMQELGGGLLAGVALLPGVPVGVAVRMASGSAGAGDQFLRAFLLPALPAVKEEASLVIPSGVYRASLVLDLHESGGNQRPIRLKSVLQRGIDFGRISFEAL